MSPTQIDENSLTKGQRRKLNALRKSVGTGSASRHSPHGLHRSRRRRRRRTRTRP